MPDHPVDVRLVALDMDGTLIGPDGRVPPSFWPLLEQMVDRGIVVVAASGRQYATLRTLFGEADHDQHRTLGRALRLPDETARPRHAGFHRRGGGFLLGRLDDGRAQPQAEA